MIFQHPAVTSLGSPGVPLQQLMPTAQGRSAAASRARSCVCYSVLLEVRVQSRVPKVGPSPLFQASSASSLVGTPFNLRLHLKGTSKQKIQLKINGTTSLCVFTYDFLISSLSHSPHAFTFFFAILASLVPSAAHRTMSPKSFLSPGCHVSHRVCFPILRLTIFSYKPHPFFTFLNSLHCQLDSQCISDSVPFI